MPFLKFNVNQAKSQFFTEDVVKAEEIGKRKALSQIGAFVRRSSRSSIRKVGKKGKSSKPGKPPKSRTGLLKDFIFFAYDSHDRSVVIGPARLNKPKPEHSTAQTVPELLEFGGQASVMERGRDVRVTYAARPYMGPALEKETTNPKLKAAWENVITPVTARSRING